MLSMNIIGAALGSAWIGLGTVFVWFMLNKTKVMDNVRFNYGLTAGDMRQRFKYIAPTLILGGAVIGWLGAPIIVPIILGES